jgi:hypothetical protein
MDPDLSVKSLTDFSREESKVPFTALRIVLRIRTSKSDSYRGLLDTSLNTELSISSTNGDTPLTKSTSLMWLTLRAMSSWKEIKLKEMLRG